MHSRSACQLLKDGFLAVETPHEAPETDDTAAQPAAESQEASKSSEV